MNALDDPRDEPQRRRLLVWLMRRGLAAAAFGALPAWGQVLGQRPSKLPPEQSVYRASGLCTVNEQPVTEGMRIAPGDALRTGRDSELVFVVGTTAMLMRAESQLMLQGRAPGGTPAALKIDSGRLLAVFAPGQRSLQTATAAVRISGTGFYVEATAEQTYFCTCYGTTDVSALDDPTSTERVVSKYHDKPLYIHAGAKNRGARIEAAPVINHTDAELAMIEALVGRSPPFALGKDIYDRPRPAGIYRR